MPESVPTRRPMARVAAFAPTPGGPNVAFDVHVGDLILLRGPNGSGKTSLLRQLAGLPSPRPATCFLGDALPADLPASRLVERVHLALQDAAETLVGLTVEGEFRMRRMPLPGALRAWHRRDVATLSSGQAQRVALEVVTAKRVPLLLLDEPADGLDAVNRTRLVEAVRQHLGTGAVVAADHTGHLAPLATRVVHLGPTDVPPAQPKPTPSAHSQSRTPQHPPQTVRLQFPAQVVRRGDDHVQLPPLDLGPGLHVVTGPNGSGKSTLLLVLAGRLGQSATVDGKAAAAGENVALLLPDARQLFTAEHVRNELPASRLPASSARQSEPFASRLVPPHLMERHPLSLSAGEGQRVALAKVLAHPARVMLLDEPDAHLDAQGRAALLELCLQHASAGVCIVVVTHDPSLQAHAHTTTALERP